MWLIILLLRYVLIKKAQVIYSHNIAPLTNYKTFKLRPFLSWRGSTVGRKHWKLPDPTQGTSITSGIIFCFIHFMERTSRCITKRYSRLKKFPPIEISSKTSEEIKQHSNFSLIHSGDFGYCTFGFSMSFFLHRMRKKYLWCLLAFFSLGPTHFQFFESPPELLPSDYFWDTQS